MQVLSGIGDTAKRQADGQPPIIREISAGRDTTWTSLDIVHGVTRHINFCKARKTGRRLTATVLPVFARQEEPCHSVSLQRLGAVALTGFPSAPNDPISPSTRFST